ncbi:zinc metalloprotease HtpX [Marinobacterium mangrovicola]|uniref:Heat shock protein HtpX n=1 Tax=Marinobacterium mangrovicola TaxID=1476959 RepID=A0A4R1GBP8_9GAMM|nr:zinc metalloprotease HtpX [Marinobacterium mangrovicola]TCK03099.1 heat shock protein HtpX [Marinobacterium mangrovicola]
MRQTNHGGHWRSQALLNALESAVLILFMGGFMAALGWQIWGGTGVALLLLVGLLTLVFNPALSPRWVMKLYGAKPLQKAHAPALSELTRWLCERAGLEKEPEIYLIPSRVMNAFSVGFSGRSAVALSDAMMRQLDLRELAGVLAHEISHIRHNDLWVMGLADLFSRMTSMMAFVGQILLLMNLPLMLLGMVTINWWLILLLMIAPLLSALAQLALSRTREYAADMGAARLTGDPRGLAKALEQIERAQGGWIEHILAPGNRVPDPSLLRTHPRTEERVERLLAMEQDMDRCDRLPLEQLLHRYDHPEVARKPRRRLWGTWW